MSMPVFYGQAVLPIVLIALPAALFGMYVASLVVPEAVRVVVPAVVESVTNNL